MLRGTGVVFVFTESGVLLSLQPIIILASSFSFHCLSFFLFFFLSLRFRLAPGKALACSATPTTTETCPTRHQLCKPHLCSGNVSPDRLLSALPVSFSFCLFSFSFSLSLFPSCVAWSYASSSSLFLFLSFFFLFFLFSSQPTPTFQDQDIVLLRAAHDPPLHERAASLCVHDWLHALVASRRRYMLLDYYVMSQIDEPLAVREFLRDNNRSMSFRVYLGGLSEQEPKKKKR